MFRIITYTPQALRQHLPKLSVFGGILESMGLRKGFAGGRFCSPVRWRRTLFMKVWLWQKGIDWKSGGWNTQRWHYIGKKEQRHVGIEKKAGYGSHEKAFGNEGNWEAQTEMGMGICVLPCMSVFETSQLLWRIDEFSISIANLFPFFLITLNGKSHCSESRVYN